MMRDAPELGAASGEALALPAQCDRQLVQAQAVDVILQVRIPAASMSVTEGGSQAHDGGGSESE